MTLEIDLFVDVVCPWCLIGQRRLDQALEDREDVTVRYHPFFLDPSTPPEGEDVADKLRRKYGGEPRRVQERVEAMARQSGIELDLRRQPRTYPTAAAHTLLRHAPDPPALARALFATYFLDGKNIADPEVLAELGARHGFEKDEARRLVTDAAELAMTARLAARAAQAGIDGVPFFVFNSRVALAGAQPVETLREAMARE